MGSAKLFSEARHRECQNKTLATSLRTVTDHVVRMRSLMCALFQYINPFHSDDFPIHIVPISMDLSILQLKGSHVENSKFCYC